MREQRLATRIPIALHATCRIPSNRGKRVEFDLKTIDLSECGALLNRRFKKGRQIQLGLSLNSYSAPIALSGTVTRPASNGSGIKFSKSGGTKKSRKAIEIFIKNIHSREAKIKKQTFHEALQNFKEGSREILETLLHKVLYILTCKEYEMKKDKLSHGDIFSAIKLAERRYTKGFRFEAHGDLIQFFGRSFGHDEALDFYGQKVQGKVLDKYDREIIIREDAIDFLFKDPKTGKHDTDLLKQNYQETRGKRLPWIRFILQNTEEVYEFQDHRQNLFVTYYAGTGMVPTSEGKIANYFLIVTHKRGGGPIELKTAFFMEEEQDMLKKICLCRVFQPPPISISSSA